LVAVGWVVGAGNPADGVGWAGCWASACPAMVMLTNNKPTPDEYVPRSRRWRRRFMRVRSVFVMRSDAAIAVPTMSASTVRFSSPRWLGKALKSTKTASLIDEKECAQPSQ